MGDFTEGFLRDHFGGLIFGGAYTWRGLFSEFYGTLTLIEWNFKVIITSCLWTVNRLVNRKQYLNLFFNFPWNVNYLIFPWPRKNFTNYSWREKSQQISRSLAHCWYFLNSGHSVSVTSFGYVLDDLLFIQISFQRKSNSSSEVKKRWRHKRYTSARTVVSVSIGWLISVVVC